MFLSNDEPAFEKICAAIAINRPHLPLSKVEETAETLAAERRIAYMALCVSSGAEPQDKLTSMVATRLQQNEGDEGR
jgi:hypothetical protein